MTAVRRELRGLVADKLRYWALRLGVWAYRLDGALAYDDSFAASVPRRGGCSCGWVGPVRDEDWMVCNDLTSHRANEHPPRP